MKITAFIRSIGFLLASAIAFGGCNYKYGTRICNQENLVDIPELHGRYTHDLELPFAHLDPPEAAQVREMLEADMEDDLYLGLEFVRKSPGQYLHTVYDEEGPQDHIKATTCRVNGRVIIELRPEPEFKVYKLYKLEEGTGDSDFKITIPTTSEKILKEAKIPHEAHVDEAFGPSFPFFTVDNSRVSNEKLLSSMRDGVVYNLQREKVDAR